MSTTLLFHEVAREWYARWSVQREPEYAEESWRRFEREVLPWLGDKPIRKITAPQILAILRRIEGRGVSTPVQKARSHISQIFRYGIACGYVTADPARDLGYALMPHKSTPRAAILAPQGIGQLLRRIEGCRFRQRRNALQMVALTFVRVGELASAEWSDIQWDDALWRIPAAKMKMKRPHDVPLSKQALTVLRRQREISGARRWVFPSRWDKSRHEDGAAITYALRRMGYKSAEMTAHGFRAMAATTLSELGWPSDVIERQLAHVDGNRVRAAYQRSELLADRRRMMQAWADWLDMRLGMAMLGR
ncbi:tyrosine-type recombinase/integrase [uncultured Desulfovibrio sp.]|uniref:tyrosine-type recombinase/integrase n=1 Tax=uncultured Desulfovibrio sp. TaxID=167968 RepID=UPI00260C6B96|nr:tyrosine-type recombinase/integrase [uncultured Desulfovibrio sp.]